MAWYNRENPGVQKVLKNNNKKTNPLKSIYNQNLREHNNFYQYTKL